MQLHLLKFANSSSSFAYDLQQFIAHEEGKLWKARFNQQVILIHIATYFLHPHYFNANIT
jgi:hypothetical protein